MVRITRLGKNYIDLMAQNGSCARAWDRDLDVNGSFQADCDIHLGFTRFGTAIAISIGKWA
jgi:hypothetical protein